MGDLFGLMELAAGAYLSFSAISGKGHVFRNEAVKKGMEQTYKKRIRLLSALLGPVLLALGIVDLISGDQTGGTLFTVSIVLYCIGLVLLGILVGISIAMTDRKKQKQTSKVTAKSDAMPHSAFDFDEHNHK